MKKNWKYRPVIYPDRLKKVFMVTKLTFLMTVCLMYGLSAEVLSQQKVTMDMGYTSVKEALAEFQRQTGQIVIYSSEKLDTRQKVEANFKDADVETFLTSVLMKSGMSYKIENDYILIIPKAKEVSQVQEKVIKGTVVDREGHPLPGVSVILKGTTIGVATDADGGFTIRVPEMEDLVLIFSFVGMERSEVAYKGQPNLKVVLKESASQMDEVVVTGYQEIKKTRMTGATETVTAAQIANKGFTSLEQVLKGSLAGVTTMSISGRPGAQAQIRIRGINSLTGSTDPMWIVDGMPMQGDLPTVSTGATDLQNTVLTSGIGNIAPDDIESITILKDAAASAIYGARAANGVIIIKTKRGRVGQSYINIQATYSIDEAPKNKLDMMNTTEKIAYEKGIYEDFPALGSTRGRIIETLRRADNGVLSRHEADAEIDRLSKINTNWYDEIFQVAHTQNYNISLSGGSEKTQYYTSLNYQQQEGVMPNNKYDKLGASLKLTHDFNKWLRVYTDLNSTVRNDQSSASAIDPLKYATFANTYERPYDENGNYEYDRSYFPTLSGVKDGYKYDFNILEDLNANTSKTRYISNSMNVKLEAQLFKGLMYSFSATFANTSSHTRSVLAPGSYSSKASSWATGFYNEKEIPDYMNRGSLTESTSKSQQWTVRNQLEYARLFKETHYVSVVLGQEASSSKNNSFSNYSPEYDPEKSIIGYPDVAGMNASRLNLDKLGSLREGQDRSASFFMSASYAYKDRYVLSGSFRMDGADIIGKDNRFSPLWSASFKWNLQEEEFIKSLGFIDVLALRGSYGYTGSIDRNAYPFTLMTYSSTSYRYQGELVPRNVDPGNPSIKWQRKQDRSTGIDFSLFRNRLNGSVNYYNNVTRDLLGTKRLPYSVGRGNVTANVASLRNTGWEVTLNTVNIDYRDFRWTTGFNIAVNQSKVLTTYYKTVSDLPGAEPGEKYFVEGHPVEAWFGYEYAGVDPLTGHTLIYVNAEDEYGKQIGHLQSNGRYVIDADQYVPDQAQTYLAKAYPPISGGFNTSFTYKRISLEGSFSFMAGHKISSFRTYNSRDVYASNLNQFRTELNRWRKPGDVTNVPFLSTDDTAYDQLALDNYIEDGSFLRCNYISLGYNLAPELCKKMLLTRARLSFNAHNLFTWTKYHGMDPETMGLFGYPSAKQYMFSLSLGI